MHTVRCSLYSIGEKFLKLDTALYDGKERIQQKKFPSETLLKLPNMLFWQIFIAYDKMIKKSTYRTIKMVKRPFSVLMHSE